MNSLTSVVFELSVPTETTLPTWLGRATYQMLFTLLGERAPDYAAKLHDRDALKPFTCSNVVGGRRHEGNQQLLLPDDALWVRFTGLNGEMSHHLLALVADPPPSVEIHNSRFTVTRVTADSSVHLWAGQTDYQALATPHMLASEPPHRRLRLDLLTPTTFRSGGFSRPIPLPEWTFGSLLKRWNLFSEVQISAETRRFATECVLLDKYRLETRAIPQKERIERGCIGWAEYAIVHYDRYWASVLNMLAAYSFFSGVGYQTTVGFGQVRLLNEY